MSETQERARAVVRAYIALHAALYNAAEEVPLPYPGEALTAASAMSKQEFSLYNNLRERFTEHLKTDAYWNLIRIATGGEDA
jgi:hypothetical protein